MSARHHLPDGRAIVYAQHGDMAGLPVLFCHGTPGSRLQVTPAMAAIAAELRIRLIVPERPGYGLSDPNPGRGFPDWAADMAHLLDALGVARLGVIGFSMGGLYALACAHAWPRRIIRLALVASLVPGLPHSDLADGMLPSARQTYLMARDQPDGLKLALSQLVDSPERFLAMLAEPMSEPDQALLADPELAAMFVRVCAASLANQAEGMVSDFALVAGSSTFDLADIRVETGVWHGMADVNVPPAVARYFAAALPNVTPRLLPDEGHLCLFPHWREILAWLTE